MTIIGTTDLDQVVSRFIGSAALPRGRRSNLTLTNAGNLYFASPNPFFDTAINTFANQTGGAVINADGTIAINADGVTRFADGVSSVKLPEPASIALLGVGLLGLGANARRRRQK